MKSVEAILIEAHKNGIQLRIEGGKLKCCAPKEKLTPEFKSLLSKHKEDITLFLLQAGELSNSKQTPKIATISRKDGVILSSAQQQLWYLHQLCHELPVYNESLVIHIYEPLALETLKQAFVYLVNRHESLRTNFRKSDESIVQIVNSSITDFPIDYYDLSMLGEKDQCVRINELGKQALVNKFDLLEDKHLLRVVLFQCADQYFQLHLVMHHLVLDGGSAFNILFPELKSVYQHFIEDKQPTLSVLAIQYADYSVWQQASLKEAWVETSLAFWRKTLANHIELKLPYDRTDTALIHNYHGSQFLGYLDVPSITMLKEIATEYRTTLFTVVTGLWSILLRCYTQQDDLIWGTIFSLRNNPDLASVIGDFFNPVPLRLQLTSNNTFEQCLLNIKTLLIDIQPHISLPFDYLVSNIREEPSLTRFPFFNTMFVFQPPLPTANGWQLSRAQVHSDTAKFDLMVEFQECLEGAMIKLEFNQKFSRGIAQQFLQHFQFLLTQARGLLQTEVDSINLLTTNEQQQLDSWNDAAVTDSLPHSLWDDFNEQVQNCTQRPALIFANTMLTYAELETCSNQVARYLQRQGIQRGHYIGLCMHRSLQQIIVLLGILKIGAAYVPLDPSYPKDRLKMIVGEADLNWVVTDSPSQWQFLENKIKHINVELAWPDVLRESDNVVITSITNDLVVYVLYTSGSTGKPKGVIHTYHSLNNLIAWQLERNKATAHYTTLQFSSINFDVSFQEIFGTLCAGGALILLSEEDRKNNKRLAAIIYQHQVQRFYLPYVALRQLAEYFVELKDFCWPVTLRELITAGEQLQITPQIKVLFTNLPNCRLHNHYGPSETHVVTAFELPKNIANWELLPSIGYPINNVKLYILNSQRQRVPLGVSGELYVGGRAVGGGYLGNSALTAERFIINGNNELLYKTGDLARFRDDGAVDYLGRIDNQIKLRGFRIEPAEIEVVLGQHPEIKQAVVLVRSILSQEKSLIAYILLHDNKNSLSLNERVRAYLQEKLPDYMIPQHVVNVPQFPLTPSGKIDKLVLAAIECSPLTAPTVYQSPRDILEMKLSQLWQDILRVDRVGLNDNFFHLGGHSLLAMKLMAKIESVFKQAISINALMQNPTLESLAQLLRLNQNQDQWQVIVPIRETANAKPIFFIPGSGGNILYFQELSSALCSSYSVYGLQARGLDGVSNPHASIEAMATDYAQQIKLIQPLGPYSLVGHSIGGAVAFAMAAILQMQGNSISFLGLLDTPAPQRKISYPAAQWDNAQWLVEIAHLLGSVSGKSINVDITVLRTLSESEQINRLQQSLEDAGVLPAESQSQRLRGLVSVLRAADTAFMGYNPKRKCNLPITLFRAKQRYAKDKLGLLNDTPADPTWGWQTYADCPIRVCWVEGDHLSMLKLPYVQSLARSLEQQFSEISPKEANKSI